DRATELGALADVAVPPHDRALDVRELVDGDRVAQHGRTDDLGTAADTDARPEVDRSGELRGRLDLDFPSGEDAGEDLPAEGLAGHLPLEQVGVRADLLADRSDVRPIPLVAVAAHRLAVGQ